MQMLHIDQMRTERDEKRQAEEQTRREEQDARMLQRNRARSKDGTDNGRYVRMYGSSSTSSGPNLLLQKFQEGTDDMGAFLDTFEATATAGRWPRD